MRIQQLTADSGAGIEVAWEAHRGRQAVLSVPTPVTVELFERDSGLVSMRSLGYDTLDESADGLVGRVRVDQSGVQLELEDVWQQAGEGRVSLQRRLSGRSSPGWGVRVSLQADMASTRFDDAVLFAPPALYDLNDIDEDGLEDYTDSRELVYRDDRLTALTVLAYDPELRGAVTLTRADVPTEDSVPDRERGQRDFLQRTSIGSLGFEPVDGERVGFVAAFPFVERARSHALTVDARQPWGAYWPLREAEGRVTVTYTLGFAEGPSPVAALWRHWRERMMELSPARVELPESLETIARLRVDALLPYYSERPGSDPIPAGFVTNCHPQDGRQLENMIQYGFTGQSVLNALHVLHYADDLPADARVKALRTIEFFAARTDESPFGLVPTLFDLDTGRSANWWSGLILPLAYASEGDDLEALMGPVYERMRYAIEPLRELDGTYLRCMAEEHHALVRAIEAERERGVEHQTWLSAVRKFGDFLLSVQEDDGSWRRAYDFAGQPLVEPRSWFGRAELNQKSSTATAVPFLVSLYRLTGEQRWLDSARKAERFTSERFVRDIKFNGGIHDSIYARAQLVDSESILFCLRAALEVAKETGDERAIASALDAARILCTWVYLWDVPLPETSTLAGHGFRSTGWSACDTAGAGYIHPYELHAVPDLFDVARLTGDGEVGVIGELVLYGSNETVATSAKDWGYARLGLQEEGLLVSWWLIDDPMFVGTHFGGRGKGEGNKTCLPWISAVGIDSFTQLLARFGSADPARILARLHSRSGD